MLFHIKQNAPSGESCPLGKGGSRSLFDHASTDQTIHGYLAFPQHTVYLVVETDDVAKLHEFPKPGARVCTAEITPVSDAPVPVS